VPLLRLEKIGPSEAVAITKDLRSAAEAISEKIGASSLDGRSP
jgi:hypothetical protein